MTFVLSLTKEIGGTSFHVHFIADTHLLVILFVFIKQLRFVRQNNWCILYLNVNDVLHDISFCVFYFSWCFHFYYIQQQWIKQYCKMGLGNNYHKSGVCTVILKIQPLCESYRWYDSLKEERDLFAWLFPLLWIFWLMPPPELFCHNLFACHVQYMSFNVELLGIPVNSSLRG